MRLDEFTDQLKHYHVTIRVVARDSSTTVHTSVSARDQQQARALLRKLFGNENVLSTSEITLESTQTDQIQLDQLVAPPYTQSVKQAQKNAHIQNSPVSGGMKTSRGRRISSRPIPDQIKHQIIQKRLTNQLLRQSNAVKPTLDDIRIARDDAEIQKKRATYQYEKSIR